MEIWPFLKTNSLLWKITLYPRDVVFFVQTEIPQIFIYLFILNGKN